MKKILLSMTFLLVFVGGSPVFAQELLFAIGDWSPFTSEKMPGHGASAEVVAAVLKEMGKKPRFEFYSWEECSEKIKAGKAFGSFPYVKTSERQGYGIFSDPIFISQTVFFHNKKKNPDIRYKKLSDLKGLKVGGIRGFFYESKFESAGLDVTYVDSLEELFRLLVDQKVDVIPENDLVGWDFVKKSFSSERGNLGTLKKRLQVVPNYLMVSKKYPGARELVEEFNLALKTLRENGTYYSIMDKYYP